MPFRSLIVYMLLKYIIAMCAYAGTSMLVYAAMPSYIDYPNQRVELSYKAGFSSLEKALTKQWLVKVNYALRTVYGELPKDNFIIQLKRTDRSRGPVPWGQVERSIPNIVHLTVNPTLGQNVMLNDWTAFHELSHLLIPYQGYGDLWFSEGLASYYQNITQGRAGFISEEKMWGKLVAGFRRGDKVKDRKIPLHQASDGKKRWGQLMRVYWSGAVFWLELDIKLRTEHNSSLDAVLLALKACCQAQDLSAWQIIEKLDQITATSWFSDSFIRTRNTTHMIDFQPLLKKLGITTQGKTTSLDNRAELSEIRQAIYTPWQKP